MRSGWAGSVRALGVLGVLGVAAAASAACTTGSTYDPPTARCHPVEPVGLSVAWVPFRTSTSCTPEDLAAFDVNCGADATTAECKAWLDGLPGDCGACLESNESDKSWGARVHLRPQDYLSFPNSAGCVAAAEGKADGSPCALAILTHAVCVRTACGICPEDDSTHPSDDFTACEDEADKLPTCAAAIAQANVECASSRIATASCGLLGGGDLFVAARHVMCGGNP